MKERDKYLAITTAIACVGVLSLAGCGSSKSASPAKVSASASNGSSNSPSLHSELPQKIRSSGVITVATYPGHPPNNFLAPDNKTVIGVDASIRTALAKELGVTFQIQQLTSFAGLIPALQSGRVNIIMSGMTDTKAREQQVTFVDYLAVGSSILTQAGNPDHISSVSDLCGLQVSVVTGTTAVKEMSAQTAQCKSASKSAITVTQVPTTTQALLEVKEKRAAATITDYPVAEYDAQHSSGALVVVAKPFNTSPYGIAVQKTDSQLIKALQDAVQEAINDGSLKNATTQWGVSSAVPSHSTINGATA